MERVHDGDPEASCRLTTQDARFRRVDVQDVRSDVLYHAADRPDGAWSAQQIQVTQFRDDAARHAQCIDARRHVDIVGGAVRKSETISTRQPDEFGERLFLGAPPKPPRDEVKHEGARHGSPVTRGRLADRASDGLDLGACEFGKERDGEDALRKRFCHGEPGPRKVPAVL